MSSFLKRLNRLGTMSRDELWMKIKKTIDPSITRILFNRGLTKNLPDDIISLVRKGTRLDSIIKNGDKGKKEELVILNYFQQMDEIQFFSFHEEKKDIITFLNKYDPEWGNKAVKEADLICEHRFNFFDSGEYKFRDGIDWHLDYTTSKKWPLQFYKDILFKGPDKIGDINYPWELSRHQYFITLGKAYWHTGDEKYAREFVEQITSWIQANPLYCGIHWISVMEHAIRIISWIWGYHFFRSSQQLTPSFFSQFIRSLWVQLKFISNNLNLGYWANNHLIGEAAGLFVGGLFLKEFVGANRWIEVGKKILIEEIGKQIHPDGVNAEQAFSYHLFTLDFFLLFKILHNQNIGSLPVKFDNRLEKMFEFLMYVMQPNGKGPPYGDSDNARGIILTSDSQDNIRGFLNVGAAIFQRSDMKWVSRKISEDFLWLLGAKGLDGLEKITPKEISSPSKIFMDGGYCVLRDGWEKESNYLLFDCGPLGVCTGAHGHADALSVLIHSCGGEMLVDPGTFAYNQDQQYRNYFRSTLAHNTVTVDGLGQAEMTDRMGWDSIPNSKVKDYSFSNTFDYVCAENDGYNRLSSPVRHNRSVISCKDKVYYLIIDHLIASNVHEYSLNFHFPPKTSLKKGRPLHANIDDRNILFFLESSAPLTQEIKEGSPEPMGWYSRTYGHKTKSASVSFLAKSTGSIIFYSLIIPYRHTEPVVSHFEGNRQNGCTTIILEQDSIRDIWIINDDLLESNVEDITFVGKTCLVRRQKSGDLIFANCLESTKIQINGKTYFESANPLNKFIK